MLNYIYLSITLTILPFCLNYVGGIKCYVCNSKEEPQCVDPFNVSLALQECSTGQQDGTPAGDRALDVVEIIMQNLDNKASDQSTQTALATHVGHVDSVCQKIIVKVGDETITSRGCSPMLVDRMHPCDAVKLSTRETVIQLRHCQTCAFDGCNISSIRKTPKLLQTFLCTLVLVLAVI